MKQTLKDFLKHGLNNLDKPIEREGSKKKYVANHTSDFDGTYFTSKQEAKTFWQDQKRMADSFEEHWTDDESDTTAHATRKKASRKRASRKEDPKEKTSGIESATLDVSASVSAKQVFTLQPERPADHKVVKEFQDIDCELDPDPPCSWEVTELKVNDVKVVDDEVHRTYSCSISISAYGTELEELKKFLGDEGYFYKGEFDWSSAINYLITWTTAVSVGWASFSSEHVNIDVTEIASS